MNRSRVTGDLTASGLLYADITNDRVGIGSTIPGNKLSLPDSAKIGLGNAEDLTAYHDGTDSWINSTTGDLKIRSQGDDLLCYAADDIYLMPQGNDNGVWIKGGGGVTLYHNNAKVLETDVNKIILTGNASESNIQFYTSDGNRRGTLGVTNSNSVTLYSGTSTKALEYASNALTLYHTGNAKLVTTSSGVTVTGGVTADGFTLGNNENIQFGASNDLKIFHNGSHSYIADTGTGDLRITGSAVHIQNAAQSENMIKCFEGAQVELYHSNSKKIKTTTTGAQIDTILTCYGAAGNPGRLRLQEGGALSEIMVARNSDSSSFLYFKTEIGGSTATRVVIDESGHFRPFADSTYDLGITGTRWRNLYADTLYGNGANVTNVNATTLDSIDSGSFLRSDVDDTMTGHINFNRNVDAKFSLSGTTDPYFIFNEGSTQKAYIQWASAGYLQLANVESGETLRLGDGTNGLVWRVGSTDHTVFHHGNDGSGSGLDADTLDGVQGASYLRSDATDTASGAVTFTNSGLTLSGHWYSRFYSGTKNYIHLYPGGHSGNASSTDIRAFNGTDSDVFQINGGSATGLKWRGNTIWTAENDGSGSGLDADTLDGVQGSSYLRSDADDTMGGTLRFTTGNEDCWIVDSGKATKWCTGTGSTNPTVNHDARSDGGTGARLHKWNSPNLTGGSYQPYQEAWFDGDSYHILKVESNVFKYDSNTVWHAGNDGSGSGLDADTLDGVQASGFFQQSGSWAGDLVTSNGFTRESGMAMTGGSEFVVLSKSGKGHVLIDGSYHAYEGGAFYSSNTSNYGDLVGFYADGSTSAKWKGSLRPETDSTYDLGSDNLRWRDLYADNIALGDNGGDPSARLAIQHDSGHNIYLEGNGWSGEAGIGFGGSGVGTGLQDGATGARIGATSSAPGGQAVGYLSFYTNPGDDLTERLRIDADGDVVIRSSDVSSMTNALQTLRFNVHQTNGQSCSTAAIVGRGVAGWGGDLEFYTKDNNSTPNETLRTTMILKGDHARMHMYGDIYMDGDGVASTQNRCIRWTGFDKESTSDFSDYAQIQHTTNVNGISGSVLQIESYNDANDGIALNAAGGAGKIALVGKMTGNIDMSSGGKITPSPGGGETGIKWNSDPYGGSGDIATIQYYQDGSGEDTRLRILIANDAADDLRLEGSTVHVQGTLTAASNKGFRIPHVLAGLTTTTDLVHSAIEGPQTDNLYRGRTTLVAGISTVNIDTTNNMTDGTFVNLNRDVQCFTTNETGWTAIKGSVTGNQLTIIAQNNTCTDTISWMVIGERWDLAMYDPTNPMTNANGKLKTEIPNDSYNKGGDYEEDYIHQNNHRVGISTISRPSIENKEVE